MPNYWFDHIHLFGPDRREMVEFYVELLGAKVISERSFGGEKIAVHLDLNGTEILVSKSDESHQAGLHHIGLRTENLVKAVEELKNRGVIFTTDIIQPAPGFKLAHLQALPKNVDFELQEGTIFDLPLNK
jgi:4-hydroxyphenylpyruvate dioxygenase-like putative hemolysin